MDRLALCVAVAAFVMGVTPMPSPAKPAGKPAGKPAARAVAAKPLICQGSVANISSTAMNGDSRSESQILFAMKMASPREAWIVGVQGASTVIKPGKYLASRSGNGVALDFNWIDSRNNSRSMTVTFDRDGTFHGSTSSVTVSTPMQDLYCSAISEMGAGNICDMARRSVQTEISGVCMEQ